MLAHPSWRGLGMAAVITTLGFAVYGFTVGCWRSPTMGLFVAAKMPLLIFCTLGCNGLLNGLLGLLLGSNLGFRQSLQALLGAFAISALILGSIAPVTFFLALNAPPPDSPQAATSHSAYLLSHTALIGMAGVIGLVRLRRQLENYCPSRSSARATLAAWMAGNAFLGAQFSWIFRPFFGSPQLEVAFLRPDPMRGSFYEAVWNSARRVSAEIEPLAFPAVLLLAVVVILSIAAYQHFQSSPRPQP
ncbi:hypothetical protein [Haloferula sargassicola]